MKINSSIILSLLITPIALACHHEEASGDSPETFVKRYFQEFNSMKVDSNPESTFVFPAAIINDGKIRYIQNASEGVFDYEAIKATGWSYSKISKVTVLSEEKRSSLVKVDFTRNNERDEVLSNNSVFYALTKTKDGWRVVSAIIPDGIVLD